jgi:nitrite reductase/ring-hydroxylating ferredoxin subunit
MLRVPYEKELAFPLDAVISQYFDFEHIEHVHPKTVGRYELVEIVGNRVRYRQHWPGGRKTSLVDQEWLPPDQIQIRFVEGRYRGVELDTRFESTLVGTRIVDEYRMPGLPDWRWVRALLRPWVHRQIERIWSEDLEVGLPRGGWSGVPGVEDEDLELPQHSGTGRIELGLLEELPQGRTVLREVGGVRVLLLREGDSVLALDARCPHAGGPLERGQLSGGRIRCPWHGSRYRFSDGHLCDQNAGASVRTYSCTVRGGVIEIVF